MDEQNPERQSRPVDCLVRRLRHEKRCVDGGACMRDDICEEAAEEIERLREALVGCVELAEFWIGQGREQNMSKERYEVWLALGHRSRQMQAAIGSIG